MKKTLTALMMAFTLLVMSGGMSFAQDYQKGMQAFIFNDYATAVREWRPLAAQGDANAQAMLGYMYYNGKGVTQEDKQAAKWYRKAAEQGLVLAQFKLGVMYETGKGVIQDIVYAHMWVNIAASTGDDSGKRFRDHVEKRMTASQIAEAQKLARECVRKNYKGC